MYRDFGAELSSVAAARGFALSAVSLLSSAPLRGHDAELIVSELVTNALRAGAEQIRVDLSLTYGTLRICVSDDATGLPEVQRPAPDAESGRGLVLVGAVADDWGVERLPEGKQVWAELSAVEPGPVVRSKARSGGRP